jgi:hypothetical protein
MAELVDLEWEQLSGGEIYDILAQKGLKLGTQANKLLRLLKEGRHLPASEESIMAKTKIARALQRTNFESLNATGLQILRSSMRLFVTTRSSVGTDQDFVISESLKSRALLLCYDHTARQLLDFAYSSYEHGSEVLPLPAHVAAILYPDSIGHQEKMPASVEDRDLTIWSHLVDDFFNNSDWQPSGEGMEFGEDVHPELAPTMQWEPYQLKQLFHSVPTPFTPISNNNDPNNISIAAIAYSTSAPTTPSAAVGPRTIRSTSSYSGPPKKRTFSDVASGYVYNVDSNHGTIQFDLSTGEQVHGNSGHGFKHSHIPLPLHSSSVILDQQMTSLLELHKRQARIAGLEKTIASEAFKTVLSDLERGSIISEYKELLKIGMETS